MGGSPTRVRVPVSLTSARPSSPEIRLGLECSPRRSRFRLPGHRFRVDGFASRRSFCRGVPFHSRCSRRWGLPIDATAKETLCKLLPTSNSRWATRPCTPLRGSRRSSASRKRTSRAAGRSSTCSESSTPTGRSWSLSRTRAPSACDRSSASIEIREIFDILRERTIAFDNQTWNRRYRGFMDKIKTGSIYDVAEVLRDLYRLKTDKQLSFGERRMLDTARGAHRERDRDCAQADRGAGQDGDRGDLRRELTSPFPRSERRRGACPLGARFAACCAQGS